MNIVRPVQITSPISGQPSIPKIETKVRGNHTIQEAHWFDPASGVFIRKGIVKITDNETGKDVTNEVVSHMM